MKLVNLKISGSVVFSVLALLICATANAAVIISSETRLVSSSGSVANDFRSESWTIEERSDENNSIFNALLNESRIAGENSANSTASMTSSVGQDMLSASGTTSALSAANEGSSFSFTRARAAARVEYSVVFTIETETFFDLTGFLSFQGDRFNGSVVSSLRNSGFASPTFNLSFGNSSTSEFNQNIMISGLLNPGDYIFSTTASANADVFSLGASESATSSFNMNLKFGNPTNWSSNNVVATPLPATAWLFGTSLVGLFMRKKFRSF